MACQQEDRSSNGRSLPKKHELNIHLAILNSSSYTYLVKANVFATGRHVFSNLHEIFNAVTPLIEAVQAIGDTTGNCMAKGPFNYYVTPREGGGGGLDVTICDRMRGGSTERNVTVYLLVII